MPAQCIHAPDRGSAPRPVAPLRLATGLLAAALGLVLVSGCDDGGEDDSSGEDDGQAAEIEPSFDVIRSQILEPKCGQSGCHSATTGAGNLFLVGDRAYESLLVTPCAHRTAPQGESRVRPNEFDRSYLWLRLNDHNGLFGGLMPPAEPLEAHELNAIERWISLGAPR